MKETYAVIHEGRHVANQLAATAERATLLACAKLGLTYSREYTRGLSLVNTPNIGQAISLACMATVKADSFEACEETPLAALLVRKH